MKIGELAMRTGLSVDAIRFYEKSGMIKKQTRSDSGYRDFNEDAAKAVEFISHCRGLDIPIPEIKMLLNVRSGTSKSCREANEVIDDQIRKLRDRIKELKSLERTLSELRSVCNQELAPKDCKIIQSLKKM